MARKKTLEMTENDVHDAIDWSNFRPNLPNYDKFHRIADEYLRANHKPSDWKSFGLLWAKDHFSETELKALSALEDWRFISIGNMCWMILQGATLRDISIAWLTQKFADLLPGGEQKLIELAAEKKQIKKQKKPPTHTELGFWLAQDLEELILNDTMAHNSAGVHGLLKDRNAKPAVMIEAIKHLRLFIDEHHELTEKEIQEGYGEKKNWAKSLEMYGLLLAAAETFYSNRKTVRAAKKTKKTRFGKDYRLVKQTEKLQYKKEDHELRLVSISPTKIVGAKTVLIYNTKTRKIGMFHAKDETGLQITGTTIRNFSEKRSIQKILRNPEEQIEHFRKIAVKRAAVMIKKNINAVAGSLNGRMNEHIVILQAWK